MLSPLPNLLNSFSYNSKATVSSLIKDMKLEKTELKNTLAKMNDFSTGSAFSAARIASSSVLDRQIFIELFRESFFRTQRYFAAMNSVGLALNSMVSVFTSEIDKIEKDIDNLELFLNHYEFSSGKDDLYNYSYIERFDDMQGEYRFDGSTFLIPDRDGELFPPGGNGFIDGSVGLFKFGKSTTTANVINKIKSLTITTNYDNYITSNSDPLNLFTESLLDSWNVTIKSPVVLTSNLAAYSDYLPFNTATYSGAQAVLDVQFTEGIPMDTIRLLPNSGNEFYVMQAVVFTGDTDSTPELLLSNPISLKNARELTFEYRSVTRIIFIFNQSSYTRSNSKPIIAELNSKMVNAFMEERTQQRRKLFSRYQDMFYWYFLRRVNPKKAFKRKNEYDFYTYRFPLEVDRFEEIVNDEIFASNNFGLDYKYEISRSPALLSLIQAAFKSIAGDVGIIKSTSFIEGYGSANKSLGERMLDHAGFLQGGRSSSHYSVKEQFYDYPIVSGGVSSTVRALLVDESQDFYEYLFSLRSIDFITTNTATTNKACFVSKKIPSASQITAIKAKIATVDTAIEPSLETYDLKKLVSYELSLSTSEIPDEEDEWFSLAFDNQTTIDSEVVFFNTTDYSAKLRFRPVESSILLYKDGMLLQNPLEQGFRYEKSSNRIYLNRVSSFASNSIFVVKYQLDTTKYSPTTIDLVASGLFKDSVRTAGDASGPGESFNRTESGNTITLSNIPYLKVAATKKSTYSPTSGTIFTGSNVGYSPVKVLLSDGSFALNLTNYTGKPQRVNQSTIGLSFIQSGRNLVFNKPITSKFKVLYDYIPENLRFRLIARRNIPNTNYPAKVDAVVLKMKALNFDPYYDKISTSVTA